MEYCLCIFVCLSLTLEILDLQICSSWVTVLWKSWCRSVFLLKPVPINFLWILLNVKLVNPAGTNTDSSLSSPWNATTLTFLSLSYLSLPPSLHSTFIFSTSLEIPLSWLLSWIALLRMGFVVKFVLIFQWDEWPGFELFVWFSTFLP